MVTLEKEFEISKSANLLEGDFPIILEKGHPMAFVVDIKVFQRLKIILDNLLNQEPEPEDALLATSKAFQKLLCSVKNEGSNPSSDWRKKLYEI